MPTQTPDKAVTNSHGKTKAEQDSANEALAASLAAKPARKRSSRRPTAAKPAAKPTPTPEPMTGASIVAEMVARLDTIDGLLKEFTDLTTERDGLMAAVEAYRNGQPSHEAPVPAQPQTARTTAPKASTSKGTNGSKRGRPAGSGERAAQALTIIRDQPGISANDLAKAMGMTAPNYVYRVVKALAQSGQAKKKGTGWHAV